MAHENGQKTISTSAEIEVGSQSQGTSEVQTRPQSRLSHYDSDSDMDLQLLLHDTTQKSLDDSYFTSLSPRSGTCTSRPPGSSASVTASNLSLGGQEEGNKECVSINPVTYTPAKVKKTLQQKIGTYTYSE